MRKDDEIITALLSAWPHVVRQQHAGKHEQDKEDAVEWLAKHKALCRRLRAERSK